MAKNNNFLSYQFLFAKKNYSRGQREYLARIVDLLLAIFLIWDLLRSPKCFTQAFRSSWESKDLVLSLSTTRAVSMSNGCYQVNSKLNKSQRYWFEPCQLELDNVAAVLNGRDDLVQAFALHRPAVDLDELVILLDRSGNQGW